MMTLDQMTHWADEQAQSVISCRPDGWNARYRQALTDLGYRIVEVPEGAQLGPEGPVFAPHCVEDEPSGWSRSSVIAPKGWTYAEA